MHLSPVLKCISINEFRLTYFLHAPTNNIYVYLMNMSIVAPGHLTIYLPNEGVIIPTDRRNAHFNLKCS